MMVMSGAGMEDIGRETYNLILEVVLLKLFAT